MATIASRRWSFAGRDFSGQPQVRSEIATLAGTHQSPVFASSPVGLDIEERSHAGALCFPRQ
jgi:hypothetical protein